MEDTQKRMYVVVRNDLSASYKMVQGAHALAEFSLVYPVSFEKWDNSYLIFVAVPMYAHLVKLRDEIREFAMCAPKKLGFQWAQWFEPDLDGQLTGLCMYTTPDNVFIKDLPLA